MADELPELLVDDGGGASVYALENGSVVLGIRTGERGVQLRLRHGEVLDLIERLARAARMLGVVRAEIERPFAIGLPEVTRAAAEHFGLRVIELRSLTRKRRIVKARMVAMYVCRVKLGLTYAEIGKWFGGRDHTTVMNAVAQVGAQLDGRGAGDGNQLVSDKAILECVDSVVSVLKLGPLTNPSNMITRDE